MGNTNESELSPFQRFEFHEEKKMLLITGFCRSVFYDYKQFDFSVITCIVIQHYDYTINTNIRQLSKYLKHKQKQTENDLYLSISLEISKMLIESHQVIRKQFKSATKTKKIRNKTGLTSYTSANIDSTHITTMDFAGKCSLVIGGRQAICPSKTIDNYDFRIIDDPTGIYNGVYVRCLSFADTAINDRGEVPLLKMHGKKYNKLEFGGRRLNIWVNSEDMNDNDSPNTELKYIRCLTRDQYNSRHCYWRLHCFKLNNWGKLLHLARIGEDVMDENSANCIQYLGIVHTQQHHYNKSDPLPQYYEYPCHRHTIWRKIKGVSFVSAHMALCYNEFCASLPQLNNVGQSSLEIRCKLIARKSKIFWNNKFIKGVWKNLNYADNKSEAKLIYYCTVIWLNELIYKVALDHGFNFKKINKQFVAPHFYYKHNWNPLATHFIAKHIFKGQRIKYYGKDIYFKNKENQIKIADEMYIVQIVERLLSCLRRKLQNKTDSAWAEELNSIQLAPHYKSDKAKLIKK